MEAPDVPTGLPPVEIKIKQFRDNSSMPWDAPVIWDTQQSWDATYGETTIKTHFEAD